ncbi:MAG: hypothetical protein HDT42_05375 [Ruminococcaceae bacterium]|nr:hypothetical protein [Oscillospiraceae bacterium]
MNCLLAKVKTGLRAPTFRKVLSNREIYKLPENLSVAVNYNPSTLLEEDEWYKIENFSEMTYFLEIMKSDFSSVNYDILDRTEFQKIDYLCSFQENVCHFQNISKSNLQPKNMLHFGDDYKFVEDGLVININKYADAIYIQDEDTLYFISLSKIAPIFKGIGELYREATDEETQKFLSSEFICCSDTFDSSHVKTPNRKRIAMAMDTLNSYSESDKKKIFKYIAKYSNIYDSAHNMFNIGNEEELKHLLWGIEQRFYTTVVGNEKRAANSIISLGSI